MRTWPALDVGAAFGRPTKGAGVSRPELFQAALIDYEIAAIDETAGDSWRVFFQSVAERDRAAISLSSDFPDLSFQPVDVPDEDWAARSQASLRAVRVGQITV